MLAIDFDSTAWPFLAALSPRSPRLADGRPVRYDICPAWETIGDLFRNDDGDLNVPLMLDTFEQAHCLDDLRTVGLYDGFVEAMNALRAEGHDPVILTDVSDGSAASIRSYLDEQGLGWLRVVRCSGKDKGQWCRDNNVPLLVDDAPHTIRDAAAHGVSALSFPYLYNAEALAEADATVVGSVGDWQAMLTAIRTELATRAAPAQAA